MQVLIISDVHANWPSLRALEKDVGQADFIIHAGDSVGYYPFPNECVNWLKEHADVNVMGNHDKALVDNDYSGFSRESRQVLAWTEQHISAINLRYLSNLKNQWVGDVGGVKVGAVHGGLTDPYNEFISPSTSESLLNSYLTKLGVKLLVTGHTHQLLIRKLSKGILVNPGSVGQPRDQEPNPSYVLMNVEQGRIKTIMPKRFSYSVEEVEAKNKKELLPSGFIEILRKGY